VLLGLVEHESVIVGQVLLGNGFGVVFEVGFEAEEAYFEEIIAEFGDYEGDTEVGDEGDKATQDERVGFAGEKDEKLDPGPAVEDMEDIEAVAVFAECAQWLLGKEPEFGGARVQCRSNEASGGDGNEGEAHSEQPGRVVVRREKEDN
jgi:hypothetical protein